MCYIYIYIYILRVFSLGFIYILGEELTAFLDRHGQDFDRIIYVGDGSNDFCPILRLRDQDTVFCRVKRGLSERIEKEAEKEGLKCQIQYWAGAWEIEEMFDKL